MIYKSLSTTLHLIDMSNCMMLVDILFYVLTSVVDVLQPLELRLALIGPVQASNV